MLLRPRFRPTLSKRRRSRPALVTPRRQSDNDKTRVSSINKRRVTPVPREVVPSRRGDEARRAGRSGSSARVPALDRIGLLDPLSRPSVWDGSERLRSTEECAYWTLRISAWACLPASNRRGIAPLASDSMNLARRRRTVPLPSETNDAVTPSVRRIRSADSRRISPSRNRSSGDRAVPPSHALAIQLRRTSHKKRYFLRHAARRRSSPSTAPLVAALARIRERPLGSCVRSVEWPETGWLCLLPIACATSSALPAFPSSVALTRDA